MQPISTGLVGAALGAVFLLSQTAVGATASSPTPAAGTAREWEVVSTASRKTLEVQRESDACVVNDVPWFFERTGAAFHKALLEPAPSNGTPLMYKAMQTAGGAMKGRGPQSASRFDRLYHVTNAISVFTYNVSDNWKMREASRLSKQLGKIVMPDSDEVRAAWEDAITDGHDIPANMLMPKSVAMRPLSWVTPDRRMVIPSASNRTQGTDDFFRLCHILSLAPEWYPEGLVNMNYPARGITLIRPVSYDGMLSPLWVQRPPDQPAATGGDAKEAFNRDAVRISKVGPMQAYIVTRAMTAALKQSPSINVYSVNLDKVADGGDAATQKLGEQQTRIVRQVRATRRKADAAFKSVVPAPGAPTSQCEPKPRKRALLLPSRRDGLTGPALQTEMTRWALGHFVQHRGQRFAAERFAAAMRRTPARTRAIMAAAAALLRRSDQPDVLAMVAQLGRWSGYRPFYVALLDRLAGRGLPAGAGIRTLTVKGDLLLRLEDPALAADAALARQAIMLAEREGRPDLRLAIALNRPAAPALLVAFRDAARYQAIDPWLAARAGDRIAHAFPDRLTEATRLAAALPPLARRLFNVAVQESRLAAR